VSTQDVTAKDVAVPDAPPRSALQSYPRFVWRVLVLATDGSLAFYAWMTALTALALVGLNAWAQQVATGMVVTNMTDHVSWGLYISNFTFMVGIAAGAVMMVIPAYLYRNEAMHRVVIVGELLAVAAIVMCLAFVTVDLGRPDRFWHMAPGVGRFNWPISMLTWDVIVLTGYLLLNLHISGYLLYMRYLGRKPQRWWYLPFVFVSIVWAISIHTVTAFLYSGLGGRPFWNTALLAPRFLASAFVAGPAVIIVTLQILRRMTKLPVGAGVVPTLVSIMRVTVLLNLFLLLSEIFTVFYSGGAHAASAHYLYFGLHGHSGLVPWIWTAVAMNVLGAVLLLHPRAKQRLWWLDAACLLVFVGIWIEKGMGLIVPGFIPSALHEMVEYLPSLTEWKITVGIWALGLIIYTIALKVAVPILTNQMRARP
jgi:Ni/Fe-hydrogenase subunit HybB-like protein